MAESTYTINVQYISPLGVPNRVLLLGCVLVTSSSLSAINPVFVTTVFFLGVAFAALAVIDGPTELPLVDFRNGVAEAPPPAPDTLLLDERTFVFRTTAFDEEDINAFDLVVEFDIITFSSRS